MGRVELIHLPLYPLYRGMLPGVAAISACGVSHNRIFWGPPNFNAPDPPVQNGSRRFTAIDSIDLELMKMSTVDFP